MEIMNIFPRIITENVGSFKSKLNTYFELIQKGKGINMNNPSNKEKIETLAGGFSTAESIIEESHKESEIDIENDGKKDKDVEEDTYEDTEDIKDEEEEEMDYVMVPEDNKSKMMDEEEIKLSEDITTDTLVPVDLDNLSPETDSLNQSNSEILSSNTKLELDSSSLGDDNSDLEKLIEIDMEKTDDIPTDIVPIEGLDKLLEEPEIKEPEIKVINLIPNYKTDSSNNLSVMDEEPILEDDFPEEDEDLCEIEI